MSASGPTVSYICDSQSIQFVSNLFQSDRKKAVNLTVKHFLTVQIMQKQYETRKWVEGQGTGMGDAFFRDDPGLSRLHAMCAAVRSPCAWCEPQSCPPLISDIEFHTQTCRTSTLVISLSTTR